MSMEQDGGPAYPVPGMQSSTYYNGMSLRDYFAGQALAGDMANPGEGVFGDNVKDKYLIQRAVFLYRMADAMIEARKAPTGETP